MSSVSSCIPLDSTTQMCYPNSQDSQTCTLLEHNEQQSKQYEQQFQHSLQPKTASFAFSLTSCSTSTRTTCDEALPDSGIILEKALEIRRQSSEGEATTVASMDQLVPIEDRLLNIVEIYNVELSPTSISIAYDSILKTNIILKKIFKSQLNAIQKAQAQLECEVTCKLNHFNLMRGIQHGENETDFHMLVEFINDADYFQEKVESCHKPIKNELKLKSYMADILSGLEFIHASGYIHCDLKLANLFCEKQENEVEDVSIRRVKIGDFGLIQKIDLSTGKALLEETCGTFGFKAPEIKKGAQITQKADIWSVGIILYFMTVAYMPHHMKGYKYGSGPIPFRDFDWKKRSPMLKDLVQKMLSIDPEQRPTAKEAMQHPFLSVCFLDNE